MPRSSCLPCCNPGELARTSLSYRSAVLEILCQILTASGGGGGGASTVDVASIAAGDNNIGNVDIGSPLPTGTNTIGKAVITDGTSDATVRNLPANDALNVSIVDAAGNQIVSFGGTGGTQYPVAGALGATPTGTLFLYRDGAGNAIDVSAASPLPVTLPAGTNNIGKVVLTDGTSDATVRNLAANDALNVAIVDAAGAQITSFGGSATQYTVGDVVGGTTTGTALIFKDRFALAAVPSETTPLPISINPNFQISGQTLSMASTATSTTFITNGAPAVLIQITGPSGGGSLIVEGSADGGTTWNAGLQAVNISISFPSFVNSLWFVSTSLASFIINTQGFPWIRVRVNSTGAGTTTYALSSVNNVTNLGYSFVPINVVLASASNAQGATYIAKAIGSAAGSTGGDTTVSIAYQRFDAPTILTGIANSGTNAQPRVDSFGKVWTAGDQTDDLPYVSGNRGSSTFGVRIDVPATITPAVGDYAPMRVSDFGAQWTERVTRTAVFQVNGLIGFGSLTNTYATLMTLAAGTKIFILKNCTDSFLYFSMNASTDHFYLDPGDRQTIDLAALGLTSSAVVSVRWNGAAPTTGAARCEAIS